MKKEPIFKNPTLIERLRGMLGVDFYRLFNTPLFYIFLGIAAIIPAMIVGLTTGAEGEPLYENAWQVIAAYEPLYVVGDIGEYANMNMVYIFGGIMVSIFIGNDYRSGYVKQLFTTHARKQDYVISKTLVSAFSIVCMCGTYLIGGVIAGVAVGADMTVNVGSLIIALLSKLIMSLGWASLYTLLNVIFRRYFGISIASSFFFGTGILIIGAAAIVGNSPILNVFLYGSSVYACLGATPLTLVVCLLCSIFWSIIYNLLGAYILYKSDVY